MSFVPNLQVYFEINTNATGYLGGEEQAVCNGSGRKCVRAGRQLLPRSTLISLLQLFQLPPAPGIHHGISVALLSSLKNHTLSKFIELTFICSKFVFFQSLRDNSVSIFLNCLFPSIALLLLLSHFSRVRLCATP